MFGNSLAGHAEMPAKLIQSLAVLEVKLIEESASTRVGQSFKDIVHARQLYATKWLHIYPAVATLPLLLPHENRPGATLDNSADRSDKGVGNSDDLIARAEPQCMGR